MPRPTGLPRAAGGIAATAAAGVAYGVLETRAFVLRSAEVPVLAPGRPPVRMLHLSDLHLTPRQHRKQDWVRGLAALEPDAVIVTGDFLGHRESVRPVIDCLKGLLERPGAFVLGSNDYYAPILKNPARYLLPDGQDPRHLGALLPWRGLVKALTGRGWHDLSNRRSRLSVAGMQIALVGVDDPHLSYDDLEAVSGPAPQDADLTVAVAHAPYLRVLDRFTSDGYSLLLAGHTHGGQLRLPGYGALVTNCDLDRGRARGLHRHGSAARSSWLHVSAGLGTSPYAPVRFSCRPEATLLTLVSTEGQTQVGPAAGVG